MAISTRLTSEKRREQIIDAAKRVFAEKGFHGTTTRMLADVAGVSEALLFKHFPSKEAMYSAILDTCRKGVVEQEMQRILAFAPSISSLAIMLHFLAAKCLSGGEDTRIFYRLFLRSLSEDGEFARVVFKRAEQVWIPKICECLQAAQKSGDLRREARLKSAGWLAHHLCLMLGFANVVEHPVVNYRQSKEQLAEAAVVFCLRGLGVKEEAIEKHYNPQAFALLAGGTA